MTRRPSKPTAHPSKPTAPPWVCSALLFALLAAAPATRPASRPASRPAAAAPSPAKVDTTPRPMSSAFAAVRYRSIFVRGNQTIGSPLRPTTQGSGRPPAPPPKPEASLVFNGVALVGTRAEALIEDTAAHKVYNVAAGGPIATGRVTAIRFDSLDYESKDGRPTRVALGQTLDGGTPGPTTTAAPTAGGGPASLGQTSGLSSTDILERMRKRREAEEKAK